MTSILDRKFFVTNYDIKDPNFIREKPATIMFIGDMHYQPNVDFRVFEQLVRYAREKKPEIIVFLGDQVETIDFIDNIEYRMMFERIISELLEIAPIVMIPGNHELGNFTKENVTNNEARKKLNVRSIRYFDHLNKLGDVRFLYNAQTRINDVNFIGFTPRIEAELELGERASEYIIEDYLKCGFDLSLTNNNILLTHGPTELTNVVDRIPDLLKRVILALRAHYHGGYLPKALYRVLGDTNVGLFMSPWISPFKGIICRGIHDFGDGHLIASAGYRKYTADLKVFNLMEKFTANDVEFVTLSNGPKEVIVEVERPFMLRK